MKAKAIDLEALRASAFDGEGTEARVSRAWLQDVFAALTGAPFTNVSAPSPEVRQARILDAIDGTIGAVAA